MTESGLSDLKNEIEKKKKKLKSQIERQIMLKRFLTLIIKIKIKKARD